MTTLVIVESPGKIKKITAILGADYKLAASFGHVRDLPEKDIGVEAPDFEPRYEATDSGAGTIAKLKKEVAAASRVLIATDPDREGEAIAWHLAEALNLKSPERITFSAITAEKVRAAINATRSIDLPRVRAQEARRVLDRLVGYKVSPALSGRAGQPLSAGRVQSPAVRLIVDREREIANFKPTEHYGAELIFTTEAATWRAAWDVKLHIAADADYQLDRTLAERVAKVRNVTVSAFEDTTKGRAPAAPFTTVTLQQAAGRRLKFNESRTMQLAQALYEAGLITYHRTDNPNLDAEGAADIAAYAREAGLQLAAKPRTWKAKEGAQEGHEAIRPSHAADVEAGENADERALYRLIWQRAVASQLADASYAVRTATLAGDADGTAVAFVARGRTLTDPGWLAVYADDAEDEPSGDQDGAESASNPVPALAIDQPQTATDGRLLTKTTKPPSRIKRTDLGPELEKRGIGRPSTYAAITTNIVKRSYVVEDKKGYLSPTPTGEAIRDALVGTFTFADLDYTRKLEDQLDEIAEGKATYLDVVRDAHDVLTGELANLGSVNLAAEHPCPECGKALRRMKGANGFFWACTGFRSDPQCKVTLPDAKGKPGVKKPPPAATGFNCVAAGCGKPLARWQGKSKAKGKAPARPYDFYGCTGYPKCEAKYQTGRDGAPVFPETTPA